MLELARISDRAIWKSMAEAMKTALGQLIISSPENLKDLEQLRLQHLQLSDPNISSKLDIKNMPVFIKMGMAFTATNRVRKTLQC